MEYLHSPKEPATQSEPILRSPFIGPKSPESLLQAYSFGLIRCHRAGCIAKPGMGQSDLSLSIVGKNSSRDPIVSQRNSPEARNFDPFQSVSIRNGESKG